MSAPPPSDGTPNLTSLSIQDSSIPSASLQPAVVVADQAASEEEEEEEEEDEEEFDSEDDSDRDDAYGYGYGYRGYDYGYDDEEGAYSDEYDDEQEYMDQLLDEDEFESTSDGGGELGRRDPLYTRFAMDATKIEIPVEWKGKGILKNLMQDLDPESKRVSLGTITPELANGPFLHVLVHVKKHALKVESVRAEVTAKTPTNALGILVGFMSSLPEFREVILSIDYAAHPDAEKQLSRLARHVGLERLDLSSSSIPTPLLKFFLRYLRHRLSKSATGIRHLSLRWDADSRICETAIVSLVKLGRKGLEYLDLRQSECAFESTKDLTTLVETVEKLNTNIQALWLPPREFWEGTEDDVQRDRLNELLQENRTFRAEAQNKARALLLPFRTIFHSRPNPLSPSSSTDASRTPPPPSLATLPSELLFEILSHLGDRDTLRNQPLSDPQVRKVLSYAEDRGTISVEGAAKSRRAFLEKVDCWRFDGSVEERTA